MATIGASQSNLPFVARVFLILLSLSVVRCWQINLSSYKTNSTCRRGFVRQEDTVTLVSSIGTMESSADFKYHILPKHQQDFKLFCHLKIPEECQKPIGYNCYCESSTETGHYLVHVNISTHSVTSQALIRGELVFKNTSHYSGIQELPTVIDYQSDLVSLYVDDIRINGTNFTLTSNISSVVVVAKCIDRYPSPCELALKDTDTNVILKRGSDFILYATETTKKMNITLCYNLCRSEMERQYTIKKEFSEDVATTNYENKSAVLALLSFLVLPFIAVLTYRYIKRSRLKRRDFSTRSFKIKKKTSEVSLSLLNETYKNSTLRNRTKGNYNYINHTSVHENCVSQSKFQIDELPALYQDENLLKYIQTIHKLTAKITFFNKHSTIPKICLPGVNDDTSKSRKKQLTLIEVCGLITSIQFIVDGYNAYRHEYKPYRECLCEYCSGSDTKSNAWSEISLTITKPQTQFDFLEKENCEIFIKDFNLLITKCLEINKIDNDKVTITFVSCDNGFVNKLREHLDESINLNKELNEKFKKHKELDKDYISVMHGSKGHICIGQWNQQFNDDFQGNRIIYSPSACPESTGCPIILIGYNDKDNENKLERSGRGISLNISGSVIVLN